MTTDKTAVDEFVHQLRHMGRGDARDRLQASLFAGGHLRQMNQHKAVHERQVVRSRRDVRQFLYGGGRVLQDAADLRHFVKRLDVRGVGGLIVG